MGSVSVASGLSSVAVIHVATGLSGIMLESMVSWSASSVDSTHTSSSAGSAGVWSVCTAVVWCNVVVGLWSYTCSAGAPVGTVSAFMASAVSPVGSIANTGSEGRPL